MVYASVADSEATDFTETRQQERLTMISEEYVGNAESLHARTSLTN